MTSYNVKPERPHPLTSDKDLKCEVGAPLALWNDIIVIIDDHRVHAPEGARGELGGEHEASGGPCVAAVLCHYHEVVISG